MPENPLAKKLLLKAGRRMLVLNAPPGFLAGFTPLPEGVELTEEAVGQFDMVLLFVRNQAELEEYLPRARDAIKYDALLWIAYPKGGAKAGTDLHRDRLWQLVAPTGLQGVTLIALDSVWSAMRFRPEAQVGQ